MNNQQTLDNLKSRIRTLEWDLTVIKDKELQKKKTAYLQTLRSELNALKGRSEDQKEVISNG